MKHKLTLIFRSRKTGEGGDDELYKTEKVLDLPFKYHLAYVDYKADNMEQAIEIYENYGGGKK